jgi:outer membrane receptor for monomeric catechols
VPLGVTYYNTSGFFAGVGGTYVNQDVDRSNTSIQADGNDDFFLVDALIGYRFPKRLGVVSLGAKNLFDKDFKYQDDSYREFQDEPSTGPYFPDLTIMGQLTLNF